MNINEFKIARADAENKIMQVIQELESTSGITVNRIDLDRIDLRTVGSGSSIQPLCGIHISVTL